MSNRKNSTTAKPATKSVLKSEHKHGELEKQIMELKKDLKQAMIAINHLGKDSKTMSAKIKDLELVDSAGRDNDDKVNFIKNKIIECGDYTTLRKFFKKNR